MSTDAGECCRRSPYYNIRRYDPIGRTMWIRDYFAGFTGRHIDLSPTPDCRCCVDIANGRIFVSGPLVWTQEAKPRSWWNVACYTLSGALIWRRRVGRDATSGSAFDVAVVNGRYFALVEESSPSESGSPFPNFDGWSIVEFDIDGRVLVVTMPATPASFGSRFVHGNPDASYAAQGLTTVRPEAQAAGHEGEGPTNEGIGRSGVYLPDADAFVVGVNAPDDGTWDVVWKTRSHDAVFGNGNQLINYAWIDGAVWSMTNNPADLFAILTRVWVIPDEISLAPGGVFCATTYSPMVLFPGDGVSEGTIIGTGSLVRLDGSTGDPVWFRGRAAFQCLASDATRLYAGAVAPDPVHPSIQRWSVDGDFIWGHLHNPINQIALVEDAGIVTVGNRVKYGVGEKNWITEGPVE